MKAPSVKPVRCAIYTRVSTEHGLDQEFNSLDAQYDAASRLIIRLKSDSADEASDRPDDRLLTVPWHKPPSKKPRQILLPHNASRSDVRPEQFERRARLVSAIARGRRWLDDVVSGRVTTVAELCAREKCSVRQVNMTISLAFLTPNLVKAAVEGRLPRGIGVERLRDPPTEWSRQFEALGLNPE
jgi:site-specific DNA recombinase